jgi:TRAP-type mannitol/chloroaromatic compound transport system permease small subunit
MRVIDRLSASLAAIAGLLLFVLIGVMIFEVFARYGFGRPTLWAGTMTYMVNGSLFVGASAYCLSQSGHVTIDFISQQLPVRVQHTLNAVLMGFLAVPVFAAISHVAVRKAMRAYASGEVDPVSAFAAVLWPFYTMLALGMCLLTLQAAATALRAFFKAIHHHE